MTPFKQRHTYDCFLASLSTVLQQDVYPLLPDGFLEVVEQKRGCYSSEIETAFKAAGLEKNTDYWCMHAGTLVSYQLKWVLQGRRALIQAPSLNNEPPAQHIVAWSGQHILDPSNKQRYRWLEQMRVEYVWTFNELARDC